MVLYMKITLNELIHGLLILYLLTQIKDNTAKAYRTSDTTLLSSVLLRSQSCGVAAAYQHKAKTHQMFGGQFDCQTFYAAAVWAWCA